MSKAPCPMGFLGVASCAGEHIVHAPGGREALTKPSGVTSVPARPPALSEESTINHDGPFYSRRLKKKKNSLEVAWYASFCDGKAEFAVWEEKGGGRLGAAHDLIQSLGSTETSRSHANDENVNVTRRVKKKNQVSWSKIPVDANPSSQRFGLAGKGKKIK